MIELKDAGKRGRPKTVWMKTVLKYMKKASNNIKDGPERNI